MPPQTNDGTLIRRAEVRDAPPLGRLGASLLATHHAFDSHRFLSPGADANDAYAAFLLRAVDDPHAAVFVAERSDEIVGYVYAGVEAPSLKELRDVAGFIHDVVVAPNARNAGIGTRLVKAAAAWLREHEMPRVMLWTADRNLAARRLFESLGFRATMIEMTLDAESQVRLE